MALWVKTLTEAASNLLGEKTAYKNVSKAWVKVLSKDSADSIGPGTAYKEIKKIWVKTSGSVWSLFYPKSGPYTSKAPYFSTDQNGLDINRIIEPIIYGTPFYGQRGEWDANGGTISSYKYKLDAVTSATIGQGIVTNIIPETAMPLSYIQITPNSSEYDGKWLIFTVKATRSDGVSGTDDTDNIQTGQGYRIPVIKNKPTRGLADTTLWINGSPGITTKPKPGDAVSLIASWDSTENKSIDATRTITKWYRSTTAPVLNTTPPQAATGGYYNTTGATLLGTGIAYVVTAADNNSYIFANQEVFNSYTDYNYGTAEGNGIKTGAAFTQAVGTPYSFAMGNILYPSTNGSIGFDSGHGGTGLPSSGRHLFVYGLDLVSISTKHWSNNKDYIIQYTGGQVFNPNVASFQITYQVKFSTDHPTYALIRIINKGSNVPQPTYIGYYEGSTQVSTVAGPYVLGTGSTYKINFDGTAGTTSGISFAGVNDPAFITDFGAGNDNTFYTLTSGTFQYTLPTIVFNTPTISTTYLSYTVASTGNDFASYDYIVRTGSHSGTQIASGTFQTGTLFVSSLSPETAYYIQVDPYNSQNQNGTRMFFTATTLPTPTISGVIVSDTTPSPGSATLINTTSAANIGTTGWTNGSNTSFANLRSVTGSGTLAQQADPTSLATSGTFTITSTGNANITIRAINQIKQASVSWSQTNAQSYTIEYSLSGLGAQTPINNNSSASSVSVLLYSSPTARLVTIDSVTVWSGPDQTGTPVTSFPTTSVTPANKTTDTTATNAVTYLAPPGTPIITYTEVTSSSFVVSWSSTNAASYNVQIYDTINGNSVTGYPVSGVTTTSASISGLQPNRGYSTTITAINSSGSAFLTASTTTSLGAALTPSLGAATGTADGFTFNITNYDAAYVWGKSTTAGTVTFGTPSGSTYPVTVTGLGAGTSATVTITTTRTNYNSGTANRLGTANTGAALTPIISATTSTATGFTGQVTNYSASYTWNISTTAGTVSWGTPNANAGTYNFTVTGLPPGDSATVTITTTRTGYNTGSATASGSALLGAALFPTFGTNTSTADGFTGSVTNYNASYTWTISATPGSVTWGVASGSTRPFTVTGVNPGTSSTVTVSTSRTGYNNGSAQTTASSITGAALTPTFGANTSTATGFTGSVTNYNAAYSFSIGTSSGSVTFGTVSGSTRPFTVTGLNPGSSATVTVATARLGYTTGSAQTTGTSTTGAALTPTFGTNLSTTGGFFGSVTNYDAAYTWGISASNGSVSWSTPSGSTRAFTVSGLAAGAPSTVTVSTSRTGYFNGSANTTGTASNPTYTITFATNGYVVGSTNTTVASPTPDTIRTGTAGQSAAAPANPTPPSGYTFAGFWRDGSPQNYVNQVNSGGSWTITAENKVFSAYYNAIVPNISSITVTGNVTAGVTCTAVMTNTQSVEYVIYCRDTTTSAWVQKASGTASANGTALTSAISTTLSQGTLPDQYYVTMTPYTGTRSTSGTGGGTGTAGTQRSTITSPKSNASGSITVNY